MEKLKLTVRQVPSKGREAGLKQPYLKSFLYPPLVVQIEFDEPQTKDMLETFSFTLTLVLLSADKKQIHSTLQNSYYCKFPFTANVSGELTTAGRVLIDPKDKKPQIFFMFNDIDIKTEGEYVFRCLLSNLKNNTVVSSVDSKPFTVFSRTEYVKPTVKTLLSQVLDDQYLEEF
ncbi:hypothetical protein HDV04_001996 [Boothiomyces sp. JEL0838]|nr:hypothetical protein HDV04_001996 [Boothiomyces sp. JEL0838]